MERIERLLKLERNSLEDETIEALNTLWYENAHTYFKLEKTKERILLNKPFGQF